MSDFVEFLTLMPQQPGASLEFQCPFHPKDKKVRLICNNDNEIKQSCNCLIKARADNMTPGYFVMIMKRDDSK